MAEKGNFASLCDSRDEFAKCFAVKMLSPDMLCLNVVVHACGLLLVQAGACSHESVVYVTSCSCRLAHAAMNQLCM